jgi:hypothetical protein
VGHRGQSRRGYVDQAGGHVDEDSSSSNEPSAVRSNEPVDSFKVQFSVPEVSHVEHFVGRSEELDKIHKDLQHDGSQKTVVVHGLGGMGKTQLVLAYAQ